MANTFFKFKQFTVWQDQCAMKVGTDGVILGAWCNIKNSTHILDVGTGTGLIAMMIAQRNQEACIDAIEIDAEASQQASENISHSPFSNRIHVFCEDYEQIQSTTKQLYDLIVSNPPYFVNSLQCPDNQRNRARHTVSLTPMLFFQKSAELLSETGHVAIIFPFDQEEELDKQAKNNQLYPIRKTYIYSNETSKQPIRILVEYSKTEIGKPFISKLHIRNKEQKFSEEYIALTKDFYLKM